ncbi:GGDEF domain-containing protein [Fictibacillus sp. Mic-4]|uniref:GGDEF domain-containing protein n=1 Tax=Fictibacillus sp. Mic-4 TaxID=3132826 RepID=UPI003CE877B8
MGEADVKQLKHRLYTRHVQTIPPIINLHLNYIKRQYSFRTFVQHHLHIYEIHLKKWLKKLCRALFYPEAELNGFMKRFEEGIFQYGIAFARERLLSEREINDLSKNVCRAVLQEIYQLLEREEAVAKSLLLLRWNEFCHAFITALLNGYYDRQAYDLKELSIRDPLTNMYNRRYFYDSLEEEMKKAVLHKYPISLVMLDINNFKHINDRLGHHAGDEILRQLAYMCSKFHIRHGFRFGGDEFVFLMPQLTEEEAYVFARSIESHLTKWNDSVSLAYGAIQLYEDAIENIDYYLKLADERMYINKRKVKK